MPCRAVPCRSGRIRDAVRICPDEVAGRRMGHREEVQMTDAPCAEHGGSVMVTPCVPSPMKKRAFEGRIP